MTQTIERRGVSVLQNYFFYFYNIKVRASRDVRPNNGFLRQLAELDNQLRRERGLLSK